MARRSPEARKIRAELDKELAESAALSGRELVWSAAESQVLELISAAIDRKNDLFGDYSASTEPDVRVKLSGEIRLLEGHIARLLKQVNTDPPAEPVSRVSQKASMAARARWDKGRVS